MSEAPASQEDKHVQAAPTLAEAVINARRKRGESIEQIQPGSQIKVRQMNPNNEPVTGPGQPNIQETRRVQQAPVENPDDPEVVARAHETLGKRLFGERFGDIMKKQQGSEPQPKPKPKEQEQPTETPPGTTPPKKQVQVKKEAPRFTLTAEDLARVGTAAAQEVTRSSPQPPPEKKPQDVELEGLDEEDLYHVHVAKEMEKAHPERYKGLDRKFVDVAKKKKEYREEWEKEHSGQQFDWDDEEHDKFLSDVAPKVSPRHFDQARIRVEAKEVAKGEVEKANEKIKELERTTLDVTLRDSAAREAVSAISELQSELDRSGKQDLSTREGRIKAAQEDKVFGVIMAKNADIAEAATLELVRLYDGKGNFKIDPEQNAMHRFIVDVVDNAENQWANLSEPFMNDANQSFVSRDEYRKMTPDQRKRHWTIGRAQAVWLVNDAIRKNAIYERDQKLDELQAVAEANNWNFDRDSFLPQKQKGKQKQVRQAAPPQQPTNAGDSDDDGTPPASVPPGSGDPTSGAPVKTFADISKTIVAKAFPREGR